MDNKRNKNSYQFYKSCLTKKELVQLIIDEIKLEDTEMINDSGDPKPSFI